MQFTTDQNQQPGFPASKRQRTGPYFILCPCTEASSPGADNRVIAEELDNARSQIQEAGFESVLWIPETGFTMQTHPDVEEEPKDTQKLAAYQCFLALDFVKKVDSGSASGAYAAVSPDSADGKSPSSNDDERIWVHLQAEMQAGKTGVVWALIRLIMQNFSKKYELSEKGKKPEGWPSFNADNIMFITSCRNCVWKHQMSGDFSYCIDSSPKLEALMVHLKNLATANGGILKNVLIVIDESHIADCEANRPNEVLKALSELTQNQMFARNVRVLTISATDPAALEDSRLRKSVRLLTADTCQSVKTLHEDGHDRTSLLLPDQPRTSQIKPMSFPELVSQTSPTISTEPHISHPQAQLSLLHKEYKTLHSNNLAKKFREEPHLWHAYHILAEENEKSFPEGEVPFQRVITWLKLHLATFHPKKQKTIADLGCGTARVHRAFMDRPNIIFHNLDHVACDERVTAVDISHTPLEDGDADVAILCLSLWGSNKEEYLVEAHRILDPNGRLLVIEPTKRWIDQDTGEHKLRKLLELKDFTVETEDYRTEDQIRKFSMFVVRKC
jgi:hypothetical protein